MKATALLTDQHRTIERLLDGLNVDVRGRRNVLLPLAEEIVAHIVVEQRVFYPCVERVLTFDLTRHIDTHRWARATLLRLQNPQIGDAGFCDELARLKMIVAQHVALEDGVLFTEVERVVDGYLLERLGDRVRVFHAAMLKGDTPSLARAMTSSRDVAEREALRVAPSKLETKPGGR
jgi:hemerythrin-like domain-containing protein